MLSTLRFWRQHWKRILFRAHKDKRSLAALLFLVGIIAYCAFEGFLLFRNPFALVALCLGCIVAWRIRKSHEKDEQALIRLSDHPRVNIEVSDSAILALRSETLRLWLLLWRASSELFLTTKTLPEGAEVMTRRAVLDKLNELGLRTELTRDELELHLMPDSGWAIQAALENLFRVAELEALQYSCGAIGALSPIEDFGKMAKIDTDGIRTMTITAKWAPRELFDIRHEKEMAALFYLRCFGEQMRRGVEHGPLDEEQRNVIEHATANAGDHNSDQLIGTQIISDVDTETLNIATGQAYLRFKGLQRALSMLETRSEGELTSALN